MGAQEQLLNTLLHETHEGPVFGTGVAFGELTDERRSAIFQQTCRVIGMSGAELALTVPIAFPEYSHDEVMTNVKQVTTKAGAFVAALSGGDLPWDESTEKLALATTAVGYMYIADQSMDRGDEQMKLAVEARYGNRMRLPPSLEAGVQNRATLLDAMETAISELDESDAPAIIECYADLVLNNEARLSRISSQYDRLRRSAPFAGRVYLGSKAAAIADLGVADAGFQSVTSSLHAAYRHQEPSLPSISELHSDPAIMRALRVCNAAARIADERGDWWMDAGNDPAHGIFTINPFNQYHPAMVEQFCHLAEIDDDAVIAVVQRHFREFNNAKEDNEVARTEHGAAITDCFFDKMRTHVNDLEVILPPAKYTRYRTYITLMRRVGEICAVNMRGDIQLSGA